MSKLTPFIMLAVLCAIPLNQAQPERHLLGRASSTSDASSSSTRGGSSSAAARADSTRGASLASAHATASGYYELQSQLVEFCIYVYNQYGYVGYNDHGICYSYESVIDEQISALAYTVAEAYASTEVVASVEGDGSACGVAEAEVEAKAAAIAKVIVHAIAAASSKSGLKAVSGVYAEAIGRIFSYAYAGAWSSACAGDESYAYSLQESYAHACNAILPTVVLWLVAGVDCGDYAAYAELEVEVTKPTAEDVVTEEYSETEAHGDAYADAYGESLAVTGKACKGLVKANCCTEKALKKDVCKCSRSGSCKVYNNGIGGWFLSGDRECVCVGRW